MLDRMVIGVSLVPRDLAPRFLLPFQDLNDINGTRTSWLAAAFLLFEESHVDSQLQCFVLDSSHHPHPRGPQDIT